MNKGIRAAIAVAIIAGGIGVNKYLVSTKPPTKKSALANKGTAVEVETVGESSKHITIRARGTVTPARQVVLGTEVGGKVIDVSPNLQPGGKFSKGDVIARVDPSDYRLAVEQQFALVDSAEAQLRVEESRVAVAKREWEMFGSKASTDTNKQLALREPQMRSATTQLKSAKSGLKRAKLSVERTLLRAPFDGMVQNRNVDLGQIVAPGAPLLSFVGTRKYWIQISLPVERLVWISVPGVNAKPGEGSTATITHAVGHDRIEKTGRVLRLLSDVDPAGHMARVLIEVDDPLGLEAETRGESEPGQSSLPLLLGSYVEVAIAGREATGIIELDRSSLRAGNEVYVLTPESTLEKRKVDVMWRQEDTVLLSGGLEPGETIITSPLSAAVDGMKLRIPGSESPKQESQGAPTNDSEKNTAPEAATKPTAGTFDEGKAESTL